MVYRGSLLYSLSVLLFTSAIHSADVTTTPDEENPTSVDVTLLNDNATTTTATTATATTSHLLTTASDELVADISKEEATIINEAKKSFLEKLLENMEPRIRPVNSEDNGPVTVVVDFHLASVSSISEADMVYQIDLYFRQTWIDRRLAYNLTDLGADSTKGYFKLSHNPRNQIWIPDLFFANERHASVHDVTVPNIMVKIYPSGKVYYSMRLTLVLTCKMELYAFPFDSQSCPLNIESYSYETNELILAWKSEPVTFGDNIDLPQFSLKNPLEINVCTKSYSTGNFPCLEARFHLKRFFEFYLLQTYIPSALIVILSWVAFWINKEAVPARVSLSVVTVMTMVAQLAGSKGSIPSVSYLKAVDVWMMMGMVFVFAALIEYAIVNSLDRRTKHRSLRQADGNKISDADGEETKRRQMKDIAERVDEACRIIFPLVFVLFNVIYWPYYLRG